VTAFPSHRPLYMTESSILYALFKRTDTENGVKFFNHCVEYKEGVFVIDEYADDYHILCFSQKSNILRFLHYDSYTHAAEVEVLSDLRMYSGRCIQQKYFSWVHSFQWKRLLAMMHSCPKKVERVL